jgi:hypothetical protein
MVGVGNAPLDVTSPTVSTVTPTDAATDVPAGAVVTATFSEPLNGATVTRGSFSLRDPDGNPVAATVSASGSTVTLRPNVRLPGRTSYTATLAGGSGGIEDLAGNSLGSDYTWSFTTGDADPPTAASTFPASSGAYSAAGWAAGCASPGFCGTASDGDSGVQRVELSILRVGTNRYWNGTSFGSVTERWLVASGTTSWAYAFPTLPTEGAYTVRVRAIDNAANQSTPTPTTFIYDATAPKVSVAFPLAAAAYTTPTWDVGCASPGICGTAADGGAGVSQVEVSIRRGTGSYWNGSSFGSAPEVFFTATGTTSWRLPFAGSDFGRQATYTVRVRATDGVGNVHAPTATKFTFTP